MTFNALYRISIYLMSAIATLALSLDAQGDSPLSMLYPPVVVAASIIAFLTVDRRPETALTGDLRNVLGVVAFGLGLLEWWTNPDLLLIAIGHVFVYLLLVKTFMAKSVEDDWWFFAIGLIQVMIGAYLSHGELIGMLIVLWAIVALVSLRLFHLRRETERRAAILAPPRLADGTSATSKAEPYPGLFTDGSFAWSTAKIALTTLVLGVVTFLFMPRWSEGQNPRGPRGVARHLTGFSEEVRLGQIGEILENDAVVMSVELYDENDRRIRGEAEPLWRGVTLVDYRDGSWGRWEPADTTIPWPVDPPPDWPKKRVRQQIKLEPTDSPILFGLRPILAGRAPRPGLLMNRSDGMIFRRVYSPSTATDYALISAADGTLIQPLEQSPTGSELISGYGSVPEPLKTRLWAIAEPLVADIPADDAERRARRLESYLRGTGGFTYSLRMDRSDPALDPIEDFLVNRKSGHCEYFASGLALLLRSVGIPTRVVNGFKGGDWNDLGRVMTVRQKHAHSWVEALVAQGPHGQPIWITLDPTPGTQRNEVVAKVGGLSTRMLPLSDFIRYLWAFYVVGFNNERQERLIYGPLRELWDDARRGFQMMWRGLVGVGGLVRFRNPGEFFSARGFLLSVIVLGIGAVAYRTLGGPLRRLFARWLRHGNEGEDAAVGLAEYRRLVEILSAEGWERASHETPREFAHRAAEVMTVRGSAFVALREVPGAVVEVFYRSRFGGAAPSEDVVRRLGEQLDALAAAFRPERGTAAGVD